MACAEGAAHCPHEATWKPGDRVIGQPTISVVSSQFGNTESVEAMSAKLDRIVSRMKKPADVTGLNNA